MTNKEQILAMLEQAFNRWEELLAGLDEAQITAPDLASNWSIKDVIAHLWAWQQISVARFEAAQGNREPEFRSWPTGFDPEEEDQLEQINTWIYETYRDRPWSQVHQEWRDNFLRFLELGAAVPAHDLFDTQKYRWLKGYNLFAVLQGSLEHHDEHIESLQAWLDQNGKRPGAG